MGLNVFYASAMAICLSHESALEYWRAISAFESPYCQPDFSRDDILKARVPWKPSMQRSMQGQTQGSGRPAIRFQVFTTSLDKLLVDGFVPLSFPVHVLVSDHGNRGKRGRLVGHSCTADIPGKPIVQIAPDAYVVAPEFCFFQLAQKRTLARSVQLADELCGTYRLGELGRSDANPLMTAQAVRRFIDSAHKVYGIESVRRAAMFMLDNSASPMETSLVILICLPRRYGGYGLPPACLNHAITPPGYARSVMSKSFYKCDLYWPDARLGVEYDSDEAHVGSDNIAADAKKRNALAYQHIEVVTITKQQVIHANELTKAVRVIAKKLGVRFPPLTADWMMKNAQLRSEVLDFNYR